MTMKKTHILGIGIGLSAAAIVIAASQHESAPTATPARQTVARGSTAAASAAPTTHHRSEGRAPGCDFSADYRDAYDLSVQTDAELSGLSFGERPTRTLEVAQRSRVRMHVETLEPTNGGHAVLLAQFASIESNTIAEARRLMRPFLLRIDESCHIAGFARLDEVTRGDARMQQALIAELDFRWGAAPQEAESMDALGTYRARYEASDDRNHAQVFREVIAYSEFWERGRFTATPTRSRAAVAVGQGPWFAELQARQTLSGELGRSTTVVQATARGDQRAVMQDAPRTQARYIWENLLPQNVHRRLARAITEADRRRHEAVRHQTFGQTLASYIGRVDAEMGFQETWPALTDYLEARPESAELLVDSLRDGEIPTNATAGVYVALGRARTAEALAALRGVMQDEGAPPFERSRAMFGLIDRDDVGVEDAEYMAARASVIHSTSDRGEEIVAREAMLALGALAGQQEDPAIMAVTESAVVAALATGETALDLRPVFGAIGNSRNAQLLTHVSDFTWSDSPDIRRVVAHAVRRMAPRETDAFVLDWLHHERDPLVHRNLFRVVFRQHHDAHAAPSEALVAEAAAQLAQDPTSRMTRQALADLLVQALPESDAAAAALHAALPVERDRFLAARESSVYDTIHDGLQAHDLLAEGAHR